MRASELLLIVRAQNQASGALRRVAGDLRGLSELRGLKQRGQSLQIARNQMQIGRQIAASELQSITTGKRALDLQNARSKAMAAGEAIQLRQTRVQDSMLSRDAQALRNQATLSRLDRQRTGAPTAAMRKEAQARFQAAQIDAQRLAGRIEYLQRKQVLAAAAADAHATSLKSLSAKEAEAGARADVLRNRIASYGDRLRLNTEQIKDNNKAMSNARWDRVAAGGRILQHSARVAQYAGLVLGGSLAVMANNAAKFDTSVTLAATQTRRIGSSFRETSKNSKILQNDIRNLMTEFPATADDFSKAAYDIYSSTSVSFAGGRKALKLFAQAAVAGMTTVQTATNMGITVLNNFKGGITDLPNKMQKSFAAVRYGRMTFEQFATSMSTIAPAARAANQSFDTMIGTFAFLTRHLDVAKARVGFARVLEALSSPKMLAGLQANGIQIQNAAHHLIPLDQIIGKILQKFPKLRGGGTDAMNFFKNIGGNTGTIQARRAFTFLVQFFDKAGKDGRSYRQLLRDIKGDHNEFTASLQAMEKTTGVRWGVFINQLKALALAIGASVIPALLKMAGPIQSVVKWWQQLDDGTKNMIGRWAAYAAGIMLVGGALSFLGGTIIRAVAFLGKFVGLAGSLSAVLIVIATAAAALTGNIHNLTDVLNNLVSLGTGSLMGWVTMLGLAAGAAIKLSSALKGAAIAEGAAGAGGLAGMLGRGRSARAGLGLAKEAIAAKGVVAGLAASAALIPGSFLLAAGAIAAVAGGALVWKRHMQGVEEHTAHVNAYLANIKTLSQVPTQRAQQFGGIAGSVEDITRQRIAIREIQRAIVDTKKELTGATGGRRAQLLDQLTIQQLDLAGATAHLNEVTARSNREFDAFTANLQAQGRNAVAIRDMRNRMADLVQQRDKLRREGPFKQEDLNNINERINTTRKTIDMMAAGIGKGATVLRTEFTQAVQSLSRMKILPKIPPGAIEDMFRLALRRGRALTIPEMKAVIKAEVSPASLAKAKADLRSVVMQGQATRGASIVGSMVAARAPVKVAGVRIPTNLVPPRNAKAIHAGVAKVFSRNIVQHVTVQKPGNLQAIGASISAGIAAGLTPVHQSVIEDVIQNPILKSIRAKSPSLWARDKVGVPIVQGIILGILSQAGQIEKTATIVANLFGGKVLSTLDEKKKKITAAVLTKDLQSQLGEYRKFNNALARLARRGVPKELIDQLAALGPEAADKIAMLSRMSAPELRKYVKLWQQTQAQVKRSMRNTVEDVRNATKQLKDSIKSNLSSTFNQMRDTNVGLFGAIFQGPTNLAGMTGDAFKQAMDDYNNQATDFRNQIRDLNQQIVDAQKEGQQRLIDAINARKDELQSAMGQLFSGDWLTGTVVQTKLDWGKKLGFDDLQKDLQSQVDKFATWRTTLTQLAAKVPPELGKQLEALGPEAVDKLKILNSGSSEQLAAYVALWQQGQNQIAAVANQTTVDTSDITSKINDILSQIDDVTQKLGALQMPHQLTAEDIINDLKAQQTQWIEYGGILQDLADRGLPAELLQQLQNLGPEALPYLRVLNTMTDTQLQELAKTFKTNQELITTQTIKDLNTQLQLWFQYGQRIGIQIAAGIESSAPALNAFFRDLINQMLSQGGFKMPGPISNPSTSGGNAGAPGSTVGGSTATVGPGGLSGAALVNAPSSPQYYSLTVNQAEGESLPSALEKATFRLMNRRQE